METSTAYLATLSIVELPLNSILVLSLLTLAAVVGFAFGKKYERACASSPTTLTSASTPDQANCDVSDCESVLNESCSDSHMMKLDESDWSEPRSRISSSHSMSFYEFMESPRKGRNPIDCTSSAPVFSDQPILLELEETKSIHRIKSFTLHVRLSPRIGSPHVSSDVKKSVSKYAELLENGKFFKTFEVLRKLGKGGFGTVYLGQHKLDGKQYAVKKVKMQVGVEEDFRSHKLFREVQSMLKLNSKYVTRYYTCWIESEQQCEPESSDSELSESESDHEVLTFHLHIQMEYCAGSTLKQWLERQNCKPSRVDALSIFMQLLKGVASIHSSQILHRDLKPENIFVLEDLQVKIGDFGLATMAAERESLGSKKKISVHSTNIGTALYTAPEQMNLHEYDEKVDVYPLGLILLELTWQFCTAHERMKVFDLIRKSHQLPSEIVLGYPLASEMILWLTDPNPATRPLVQDVLESSLLTSMKADLSMLNVTGSPLRKAKL